MSAGKIEHSARAVGLSFAGNLSKLRTSTIAVLVLASLPMADGAGGPGTWALPACLAACVAATSVASSTGPWTGFAVWTACKAACIAGAVAF